MDISLKAIKDCAFSEYERQIFHVIKATLQSRAKTAAKSTKIAQDIAFFCISQDEGVDVGETLWNVWAVVVEMASRIPAGHAWQDSLVLGLDVLREQDGAVLPADEDDEDEKDGKKPLLWQDLPNLALCPADTHLDPTETAEDLADEFARWRNLNSFVARVTSDEFAPWRNLSVWQLRGALEKTPLANAAAFDTRVWVATEWAIECADPVLAVERWAFWKARFAELRADAANLGLSAATAARISEALKSMEAVHAPKK
ncbi:hypothetical protein B0T26DRAFT_794384 [Lasiosphaeria miniovina]|uniref:Uncharacterized protein n=1 Tax=Lasiosphaeria miniovina TaxID=1954250 RepID=A0AA39ZUS6_9PEZI|nr:uncharacterized protein B0T26DRAFT_794384 [Lasiosphaeria miniovina]KAK0703929.1 hypothetical protein B0T26DRAFT_794384 [Lasiosphaeria miniovina]